MVVFRLLVTFDKLMSLLIILLSFSYDWYYQDAKTTYFAIPAAATILGVKKVADKWGHRKRDKFDTVDIGEDDEEF